MKTLAAVATMLIGFLGLMFLWGVIDRVNTLNRERAAPAAVGNAGVQQEARP